MPRPKIPRKICGQPFDTCFKPNGLPMHKLDQITLGSDEFEAIRLVDLKGLLQQEAAIEMGVSRQTLANILKQARSKVATCLCQGKALVMTTEPEAKEKKGDHSHSHE